MRERAHNFDKLKGISCIAVLFIHYNFPDLLGIGVKTICRFAVPVFFMVSGYFMLNAQGEVCERRKIVHKILHIARILLSAGIFYALFCILWNLGMNSEWKIGAYTAEVISKVKAVKFFVTNDPFVYSHLWFLLALIYIYICMLPFGKKYPALLVNLFPLLLCGFLIVALWKNVLHIRTSVNVFDGQIYLSSFFVFRAMPFFLAGMWIRRHKTWIQNLAIPKNNLWIIALFGTALSLLERNLFVESQFYLGTYLTAGAMFIWAVTCPEASGKDDFLTYVGRELSTYVYILHIAVGKTFDLIAAKASMESADLFRYTRAFLVLGTTLLVAMLCSTAAKGMSRKLSPKK